ncbi:MAG: hypothetical protein ACKV2T_04915 [Kofleriaceae bacterium]
MARSPISAFAFVTLVAGGVAADDFDHERIPVRIAVGETKEIEVGFARMHVCDDPTIVEAEMRDKTTETNVFVVKGIKPGTTDCRAGMDPDRPSFLFSITVEKRAKPATPAPKTPKPR